MNKFLKNLGAKYSAYTKGRNTFIVQSRDILKHAKAAGFALHRGELGVAETELKESENIIKSLLKLSGKVEGLDDEGAFRAGLEEYAEAKLFAQYLKTGDVSEISGIKLDHDIYIGAISDVTGELVRLAIAKATLGDGKSVKKYRDFVEEVVSQLATFDLTSGLRNKYDSAKRNLYKLEEILYDLSLK